MGGKFSAAESWRPFHFVCGDGRSVPFMDSPGWLRPRRVAAEHGGRGWPRHAPAAVWAGSGGRATRLGIVFCTACFRHRRATVWSKFLLSSIQTSMGALVCKKILLSFQRRSKHSRLRGRRQQVIKWVSNLFRTWRNLEIGSDYFF